MSTPTQLSDFRQRMAAIQVGVEEYRKDIIAYAEWMDDWRKREAQRVAHEIRSQHVG